jgi:hypothetical protein
MGRQGDAGRWTVGISREDDLLRARGPNKAGDASSGLVVLLSAIFAVGIHAAMDICIV